MCNTEFKSDDVSAMAIQFMNFSDFILIGSVHISDENSIFITHNFCIKESNFYNFDEILVIGKQICDASGFTSHISDENLIVSKTDESRCFAFAMFIFGSKLDPKATTNFVLSNIKQNY